VDLCDGESPLRLETATSGPVHATAIVTGPRIGVGYAGPDWSERAWRFAIADHPSVSGPRATR
jgi:3-methyladenine DNA glycosylase Mpg